MPCHCRKPQRSLEEALKQQTVISHKVCENSALRTEFLPPISCDGALNSCRKPSVGRRETRGPCRLWLHRTSSTSASDPQQGWNFKRNTAMSPADKAPKQLFISHTHSHTHTPMSLLYVVSLYCWWTISLSTVNFCSLSASVSLMAVFPRYTDMSLRLVSSLDDKTQNVKTHTHTHTRV